MLQAVAGTGPANVDLTGAGKGKRVASWCFSNVTAAATINLRDGSVTGTRFLQIQLPINASASQSYSLPGGAPLFPSGVFVEIVAGTVVGSIDLI